MIVKGCRSRESTWVGGGSQWDLHNGHIHTCTILQLYIADTSYFIIQLPYTNSSLSWLFILNLLPLPPSFVCRSTPAGTRRSHVHSNPDTPPVFWKKAISYRSKKGNKKSKQPQSNFVHIYFFSFLIFLFYFFYVLSTFFNAKCEFPDQDKDSSWQWTKTVFLPLFKSYEKFNGDFIS